MIPVREPIPASPEGGYWQNAPHTFGVGNPHYPGEIDVLLLKEGWLTLWTEFRSLDVHVTFANAGALLRALSRAASHGKSTIIEEVGGREVSVERHRRPDGEYRIILHPTNVERMRLMELELDEVNSILEWYAQVMDEPIPEPIRVRYAS